MKNSETSEILKLIEEKIDFILEEHTTPELPRGVIDELNLFLSGD